MIRPNGWDIRIVHPETGRQVRPAVRSDPQFLPNPNGRPELSMSVPKDAGWLADEWDGATVTAYHDGDRVPVERIAEQTLHDGHVELIAEGATELIDTVNVEIGDQFSHEAFESLITEHTDYAADVDVPAEAIAEDELLLRADDQAGWQELDRGDVGAPLVIENGDLITKQAAHIVEGENVDTLAVVDPETIDDSDFSDGTAVLFKGSAEYIEHSFSLAYEFEDPVAVWRYDIPDTVDDNNLPNTVQLSVDGTEVGSPHDTTLAGPDYRAESIPFSVSGSTTLRLDVDESRDEDYYVDVLYLYDAAAIPGHGTWDNSVHEPDGYLDDPPLYPDAITAHFGDAESVFAITAGELVSDFNDTSNAQAIAISPDSGDTWTEAGNSETVSADFSGDPTTALRARLTLSNYSPQGARNETPRLGYAGQTVDWLEFRGDIDESPLTVDYSNEDALESILNDIAGQSFIWEFRYENDTPTVALTQPGSRVTDRTPDIVELSVSKTTQTYEQVTVRGANRGVDNEQFSASETFQALNRNPIIPGTEVVHDDQGTVFNRGEDYEMRWTDGEIRRLGESELDQGETYFIDYQFEVRGTYTLDDASNPTEQVVDVPGVVSERSAEILARQFVQILSEPQWTGEAVIPAREDLFSGIEALNIALADAEIPADAMPLTPAGRPEISPEGTRYSLGSGPDFGEIVRDVRSQIGTVSRRV